MPELLYDPIAWLILSGMIISLLAGKLSVSASLTGGAIAFLIYFGLGATAVFLLSIFFILGSTATSWKSREKKQMKLEESREGRRVYTQVIANAGVPALCAALSIILPEHRQLLLIMTAGSFSAATADTLSSELGNLYGRRFYNILSFKPDLKGLDGVISMEGTLFGVAGSTIIAIVYCLIEGFDADFLWIILAGTLGNILDSVLGASLEQRKVIGNNTVNFCNTASGALVIFFYKLIV